MSNVEKRLEAARRELKAALAAYDAEQERAKEWEPEGGPWFVTGTGNIVGADYSTDGTRCFGAERPIRQLAEQAHDAMRVHNRALAYVHEHAPEWDGVNGYSVEKQDRHSDKWEVIPSIFSRIGTVTGPRHVMQQLADDLNSGRVKL